MTFNVLQCFVEKLSKFANETRVIGKSVQGRPIYAFHAGAKDGKQIIIQGAIHAREWITAHLVGELLKDFATIGEKSGGAWFIPMMNPDGVKIALTKNPLWKANARGVDLNVNFDADWGGGAKNVRVAGAENYIGEHPESEPETRALVDFTKLVKPASAISYHSKGEVIYHQPIGAKLAKRIGEITGYTPEPTKDSTGGYTDWLAKIGIPAVTIEVGNDNLSHPIGLNHLKEIFNQNKNVPRGTIEEVFHNQY